MQALYPEKNIRLVDGPGICKAENVWTGFRAARGDILMILDADLTVMPEELPMFFRSLVQGHGGFVNGSRLVYPMPDLAMKFANMIGNNSSAFCFRSCWTSASKIRSAARRCSGARTGCAWSPCSAVGVSRISGRLRASVWRQ